MFKGQNWSLAAGGYPQTSGHRSKLVATEQSLETFIMAEAETTHLETGRGTGSAKMNVCV